MAYGDLASGICALIAVTTISTVTRYTVPFVALFSIIGIADMIKIGPTALNADVFEVDIGNMWFVLVTCVQPCC